MDWVSRGVPHYFKQNPDMLLDVMIAFGEKLKNQPKKKKEKFFAILEEEMRKRVRRMEESHRSLYEKVSRLEKKIAALSRLSRVS